VNAREIRRALRRQRAAMRAELKRSKQRVREQLAKNPQLQARARRRRRRRQQVALAIAALIALALLRCCSCGEGAPQPVSPETKDAGTDAGAAAPLAKKPLTAPRVGLLRRGDLKLDDTKALPWLDEFRMQVAARSPKLANCFHGADKPGALRWTTELNPTSGQVSNHALEPIGGTLGLNQPQRECLVQALSEPRYRLQQPPGESSTPSRVSIMLEF
jgi:hypothetical protein